MLIIPASADNDMESLTFQTVNFSTGTDFTPGEEIKSIAAGDVFAVKIILQNPNDSEFYAKALDLWIQYDDTALEPYSYQSGRSTVGPVVQLKDDFFSLQSTVQNGVAKLAGADSNGTYFASKGKAYDSTVIAYLLFKVKNDAETCDLVFTVTGDNTTHALLIAAGLGLLAIWPGVGGVLCYLVYAIFGNLVFLIIQRYNRT